MFIFYYAVLSEVSPPTALSPFAAAALTGADPMRTTLQTWKYTHPGVRRAVHVHAQRARARAPPAGSGPDVLIAVTIAASSLACFAAGSCGWIRKEASVVERVGALAAGGLLIHGSAVAVAVAGLVMAATLSAHLLRTRRTSDAPAL